MRPQSDDDVLSSFSKISQDNLLALQKENLVKEVDVAGVRFYRRG